MTPAQMRGRVEEYRLLFLIEDIPAVQYPHEDIFDGAHGNWRALKHAHYMLDPVLVFLDKEEYEKAHRWFGFLQGILWVCGRYSLETLREHNRSLKQ